MEISINISKRKKSIWDNPIIALFMKMIISPIIFVCAILTVVFVEGYGFVKHKIFGIKERTVKYSAPIFMENKNFKLIKEHILGGIEEYKIATDFLFSIADYDDEIEIFKVINDNKKTELDGEFLTGFYVDLKNEILLQRIKYTSKGEPTSELIVFDPNTGKVNVCEEIGIFELYKFDKEKNVILGGNKIDDIRIKIKASA
ncbi:hypothetical protein [Aequorivita antarctica]|uniref:Uncharacterized protein n=1 Tax=Aequorivita antarctica TaxID=153266 RepID=A0A5C6YXK8_9FLAO|nr:hypothetical protein [Aequorivita antarctica]TXD72430.1 hypothetical protein ESU54_11475 [Aequorivita antarctica]SRX75557.1 hypothetical protein AEQU3_02553 [Aequorivita antarctica]